MYGLYTMLQYSLFMRYVHTYIVCIRYLILIKINLNKLNCLLKVEKGVYDYLLLAIFHFILSYGVLLFCQGVIIFFSSLHTHLLYISFMYNVHCTVLVYVFVTKNKKWKNLCLKKFLIYIYRRGGWQRWLTFTFEYIRECSYTFKMASIGYSGPLGNWFVKKQKLKISCQTPFNIYIIQLEHLECGCGMSLYKYTQMTPEEMPKNKICVPWIFVIFTLQSLNG